MKNRAVILPIVCAVTLSAGAGQREGLAGRVSLGPAMFAGSGTRVEIAGEGAALNLQADGVLNRKMSIGGRLTAFLSVNTELKEEYTIVFAGQPGPMKFRTRTEFDWCGILFAGPELTAYPTEKGFFISAAVGPSYLRLENGTTRGGSGSIFTSEEGNLEYSGSGLDLQIGREWQAGVDLDLGVCGQVLCTDIFPNEEDPEIENMVFASVMLSLSFR